MAKLRRVRAWITVLAAILVAMAMAALVAVVAPRPGGNKAPVGVAPSLDAGTENYPPRLEPMFERPAQSAGRRVSPDVLRSADIKAAPWAPGLALRGTRPRSRWEQSRAFIEELSTGDTRSYAIGDLLPRGCLLVGISTAAVDILVADTELIRMKLGGKVRSLVDFRTAYEARPPPKAKDLAPDYRAAVQNALNALETSPPEQVQAYIDELIACGDPVVELLVPSVGAMGEVAPAQYDFRGRTMQPQVVGDVVIGVLEVITGQTFGDPTLPGVTGAQRTQIADDWRRWWGLE